MPETEIWALISLASIYDGRRSKVRSRNKESTKETILYHAE